MKTWDLVKEMVQSDKARLYNVNQNMIEISRMSRKKSAFVKVAIGDDDAEKLLKFRQDVTAFMIFADRETVDEILAKENKE